MPMNRRQMLGTGAAAVAAAALPGGMLAQEETLSGAGMVAGGGAVETVLGPVDFGLVAVSSASGELTGTLTLRDLTQPGNPVVMQSTLLSRLEADSDVGPDARRLIGWVSAGGKTAIFVLQVEDLGGPGSGKDTLSLHVGTAAAPYLEDEEKSICDCADYSYSVEGMCCRGRHHRRLTAKPSECHVHTVLGCAAVEARCARGGAGAATATRRLPR